MLQLLNSIIVVQTTSFEKVTQQPDEPYKLVAGYVGRLKHASCACYVCFRVTIAVQLYAHHDYHQNRYTFFAVSLRMKQMGLTFNDEGKVIALLNFHDFSVDTKVHNEWWEVHGRMGM